MARKRQTTAQPKPASKQKPQPQEQPVNPESRSFDVRQRFNEVINPSEYRSKAERDARLQRIITLALIILSVFVGGLLFIAIANDFILTPGRAVASVTDENITVSEFRERVRIERALHIYRVNQGLNDYLEFTGGTDVNEAAAILNQPPYQTWWSELEVPDQMGLRVLEDMIDDRIIMQYAAANNITVSEEDIDAEINDFLGYDPEEVAAIGTEPTATPEPTLTPTPFVSPTPAPTLTSTPTPSPTATIEAVVATAEVGATDEANVTPEVISPTITAVPTVVQPTLSREEVEQDYVDERQNFFNLITGDAEVSEARVREYFRMRALRDRVRQQVTGIEETDTFANSRHILVATEEEAQDVLTALAGGASFAELARQLSVDTTSGAQGGELGWTPVFQFVGPFAEAVRTAPIGETVGPVETEFGFHIIQVTGREERELTETQQDNARQVAFTQWLDEQSETVESEIFSVWTDFVPETPQFVYRPR